MMEISANNTVTKIAKNKTSFGSTHIVTLTERSPSTRTPSSLSSPPPIVKGSRHRTLHHRTVTGEDQAFQELAKVCSVTVSSQHVVQPVPTTESSLSPVDTTPEVTSRRTPSFEATSQPTPTFQATRYQAPSGHITTNSLIFGYKTTNSFISVHKAAILMKIIRVPFNCNGCIMIM